MPVKISSGVFSVDENGIILFADASVESIFAYEEGELTGKQARIILPDVDDVSNPCGVIKKIAKGNDSYAVEVFGLTSENEIINIEISVNVITHGKKLLYVCRIRDFAEQRVSHKLESMVNNMLRRVLNGEGALDFSPFVCSFLCNLFSFPAVWIGAKDKDGTINILGKAGKYKTSFIKKQVEDETLAEKANPAKEAFRTKRTVFFQKKEIVKDEVKNRQVVTIPLSSSGDTIGILQVFSSTDMIDKRIVNYLWSFCQRLAIALKISEDQKRLRLQSAAIASTSSAVMITDVKGEIEWVNDAFVKMSGYKLAETIGKNPSILKSGVQDDEFYDDMWNTVKKGVAWSGEVVERHRSGALYTVEQTVTPIKADDGEILHYVAVHDDLTARKYAEGKIHQLANYDQLTGLHNRTSFMNHLENAVQGAKLKGSRIAVLFVDLTNFNRINDTLGHVAGDRILKIVASRLGQVIPETSIVARMDGDEFALAVSGIERTEEAATIACRIIETVLEPIKVKDDIVNIGACVGLSIYPDDAEKSDRLVTYADMALHKAVNSSPNSYFFFSKEMNAETEARLQLEQDLRKAIINEEFVLHYQPQIDMKTGKIAGWEALVRWQHPEKGMVPPGMFIPIAEDTGLIVQIGDWVMREALSQARKWLDEDLLHASVAINLSAIQFQQEDLAETIVDYLRKYNVDPKILEIELTETVVMKDVSLAHNILSRLSEIGVQISIDDFGTGYSSLNYLKRFPVDRLKIDQSFVRDMTRDDDDATIAGAIVGLGHSLSLEVVSEGVETKEQYKLLSEKGCDIAQGYLMSRPIPSEKVPEFVKNFNMDDLLV